MPSSISRNKYISKLGIKLDSGIYFPQSEVFGTTS